MYRIPGTPTTEQVDRALDLFERLVCAAETMAATAETFDVIGIDAATDLLTDPPQRADPGPASTRPAR